MIVFMNTYVLALSYIIYRSTDLELIRYTVRPFISPNKTLTKNSFKNKEKFYHFECEFYF